MRFIRIKAVSECIGIRRSSLYYAPFFDNQVYDVSSYEHPLNSLKEIKINKACVSFLGNDYDIDHIIIFKLKASSLGKEIEENCHLEIKFIEVKDSDIERLKEKFDSRLDNEYAGEFEFIVGYYLLNNNKGNEAREFFKESLDKGFRLSKRYLDNYENI